MKVVITLEDTPRGVYPMIQWTGNDVTDHVHTSLSMNLAAQFANLLKQYTSTGALKVTDEHKFH